MPRPTASDRTLWLLNALVTESISKKALRWYRRPGELESDIASLIARGLVRNARVGCERISAALTDQGRARANTWRVDQARKAEREMATIPENEDE